jgi:hypothetical protein
MNQNGARDVSSPQRARTRIGRVAGSVLVITRGSIHQKGRYRREKMRR